MDLTLPQYGLTMTEGTLVSWLVEDGADVTAGQAIYLLEAEKAQVEVEAPVAGKLRCTAKVGQIYTVGDCIGSIE